MTPVPQQRILVIGKIGQIGWSLQRTLSPLGEIVAKDHIQLDLSKPDLIVKVVREVRPTLIVNAGAYTAVDKAESEKDLAMAINGTGPGILAEEAKKLGAGIVHYSTDYVFDGTKDSPYTEDDTPKPLNTYGKSKLAGDQAVQDSGAPYLIFRTSWVYGMRGQNFLRTILHLFHEREEIRIVDDQFGAPTWSRLITETTAQVLAQIFSPQTQGFQRHLQPELRGQDQLVRFHRGDCRARCPQPPRAQGLAHRADPLDRLPHAGQAPGLRRALARQAAEDLRCRDALVGESDGAVPRSAAMRNSQALTYIDRFGAPSRPKFIER